MSMTSQEYVNELVSKARRAQEEFEANFTTQRAVDEVVRAVGLPIFNRAKELAEEAVEETHMGTVDFKITKIMATCIPVWNSVRGQKSMGYIDNIRQEPGVKVIAKPIGVVGIVTPSTNPIVTIVHNAMCAIKCRNACIVASHPSAKIVSEKVVNIIRAEFAKLGAPEDLLQIVSSEYNSLETTDQLIAACDVNVATGGPGMVKAIYSCGKPGFGVGQGNDQEIIAPDWDNYELTCKTAIGNRSWDNGVPCTGEQMIHVPADKEELFLETMEKNGAYIIKDDATRDKFRELIFPDGHRINRKVVGRSPKTVAAMLGIDIPDDKKVLLTKVDAKGEEDVLCKEILFPFSRYRTYTDFEETVDTAVTNLKMEGAGHSSSIWAHDEKYIDHAAMRMPVSRLHINQSPQGSGNGLNPTTTLGCGFWSGNSTNENLTWYQFMQTTRTTVTLPKKHQISPDDWDNFDICPVEDE